MAYADYSFYKDVYLGAAIEEPDFDQLAERASRYIDYLTRGKAKNYSADDSVKLACCALAEQFQTMEDAQRMAKTALSSSQGGAELQSQSVGSWSKTYRSAGDSAKQAAGAVQAVRTSLFPTAQQYLSHTGLLYRGRGCGCGYVSPCCDSL